MRQALALKKSTIVDASGNHFWIGASTQSEIVRGFGLESPYKGIGIKLTA